MVDGDRDRQLAEDVRKLRALEQRLSKETNIRAGFLGRIAETLLGLGQDAARWRAVRTRFPAFGHPIVTPESADSIADHYIAELQWAGRGASQHAQEGTG